MMAPLEGRCVPICCAMAFQVFHGNCHGNIGPGKIGPAGLILDTKTGPAGPNLVDQV